VAEGTQDDAAAQAAAAEAAEAEQARAAEKTGGEPFDQDRAMSTIKAQRESEAAAKKRAAELEAKVKEYEDRDKTEQQKAAEATETSKREAAEAKAEAIRLRMLLKYGLDEEDLDLLGAGDETQIEARAKRLSERSGGKADDTRRRPKERLRTGATRDAEADEKDPSKLAASVSRGW
jgi:hypothetical protein